jgi:beta-fructofuranosidase
MAELLSLNPDETLFGVISGGIRDVTPTTFLYVLERNDPVAWKYVGPLANIGCNLRLSRWSRDLGQNWEVVNFMTLQDEENKSVEKDFLIMGTEGCLPSPEDSSVSKALTRPARCQLWMLSSLHSSTSPGASPVKLKPGAVGHLDHGCFYAANSFRDPVSHKQIVWGWVTEDDLCDDLRQAQGWAGMLALPRAVRIQTLNHVVSARASVLEDVTNVDHEKEESVRNTGSKTQLWTIRTLASEPVQSVVKALRSKAGARCSALGSCPLQSLHQYGNVGFSDEQLQSSTWELSCSIRVSRTCRSIGFTLAGPVNGRIGTTLAFSPQDETITIHRPSIFGPGSDELINSEPERAPHTLFTALDPDSGVESEETLDIRAWRDNSVLEVFVNSRTAITTRIYGGEGQLGLTFFADDTDRTESSELACATLWDGIGVE